MVTCKTPLSTIQPINNTYNKFITDQRSHCKYDVTLRCVHVIFIPPRLSKQPDNISYKEGNFFGDFMSPATVKPNYSINAQCPIHLPDFNDFGVGRQIFINNLNIK